MAGVADGVDEKLRLKEVLMPTFRRRLIWPVFLVLALLTLGAGNETLYGIAVPLAALLVALVVPLRDQWPRSGSTAVTLR